LAQRRNDGSVALRRKLLKVNQLLLDEYGHHQMGPYRDPVDDLVGTILSQNTSDVNSRRAFARLRERFPSWEAVLEADDKEIAEAIRPGGLENVKAPRIKAALRQILDQRGELNLDFLEEMKVEEAKAWLESLEGVGPKTAAIILLFSFGKPVLPVDTHVLRVSRRVGLVEPRTTAEKAHEELGAMVPDDAVYDFHINMVTHGRRICHAQRPQHDLCVLAPLCDYLHKGR
jgi:endonuclease-3